MPEPVSDLGKQPKAVVVGLGNPGERYQGTRHNVGFEVLAALAKRRALRMDRSVCQALVGEDDGLMLVAPQTFMNRSGYSLRCLVERAEVDPARILVVYDEVHLPLGRLRFRRRGSVAGHRGLESILENLGTDAVHRLRLGVAPEVGEVGGEDLVEFVLAPFAAAEEKGVEAMVGRAAEACEAWALQGIEAAMQGFNG